MTLSKLDILNAKDAKLQSVEVPDWGGTLYLRVMSASERDAYEDEMYRIKGKDVEVNRLNARARLLVRCLCDEQGTRLFSDDDAKALGAKSAKVMGKLFDRASKLNGLSASDVEELEKN
jgi:hypothetical protein